MAVNLSPIWGAGAQLLDNSGNVLSGGKIYTYLAGTTTPTPTYTSNSGATANSNPIILNSAGRVPYEIWLTDSISYKFVLKDSNDTLIGTWDNLIGINSNFINYYGQQEIQTATAGQTVFTLADIDYVPGTNNLSVFVDGVNQYGPGAQYAFVETDSTTITFVSGLHVGASVKFTTTKLENVNVADASQISYTYPDSNAVAESVEARLAQYVSVKDFGAVGDGVTDDYTAWSNAVAYCAANGLQLFAPSTDAFYNIGTDLYIDCAFSAGVYHVFGGSGTITFNTQYNQIGYPEWWGAVTNDSTADCTSALESCVQACPVTQLQLADYWINTTWVINTNNRVIKGIVNTSVSTLARILTKSKTADIIFVGQTTDPGSVSLWTQAVIIENITVWRSTAPTPPLSGDVIDSAAGVRFNYIVGCQFNNILSYESLLGFAYENEIFTFFNKLNSFRSISATSPTNDLFWGHALFNRLTYGSQSCYWSDIHCEIGGSPVIAQTIGIAIDGHLTDCSFNRPECNNVDYGFYLNNTGDARSIDSRLVGGVFDQVKKFGILLSGVPYQSQIVFDNNYITVRDAITAVAAISINNSDGQIVLTNNQSTGVTGTSAIGLELVSSKNISCKNNMWAEMTRPISIIDTSNCVIEDSIVNTAVVATYPAITMQNADRNYVKTLINGMASNVYLSANGAVNLNSACSYNEINCTSIDPSGIQGGSANKLIYNGTQITSAGTFGTTNLASGIMG